MKTKIILTRRLPDSVETRMRELFDATLNQTDQPFTEKQLIEAVKTAEVLVPTVTDNLNASIIEKAGPQLRLIASFGTGVDHIDVKAAREKGITVTNTPGVLSEDTADVALALILAVPRRIVQGDAKIRSGQWHGWSPTGMLGHRINGKRLGINKADLMTIARDNNIKKGEKIIEELNNIIKSWNTYADRAELRKDLKEKISANLNTF